MAVNTSYQRSTLPCDNDRDYLSIYGQYVDFSSVDMGRFKFHSTGFWKNIINISWTDTKNRSRIDKIANEIKSVLNSPLGIQELFEICLMKTFTASGYINEHVTRKFFHQIMSSKKLSAVESRKTDEQIKLEITNLYNFIVPTTLSKYNIDTLRKPNKGVSTTVIEMIFSILRKSEPASNVYAISTRCLFASDSYLFRNACGVLFSHLRTIPMTANYVLFPHLTDKVNKYDFRHMVLFVVDVNKEMVGWYDAMLCNGENDTVNLPLAETLVHSMNVFGFRSCNQWKVQQQGNITWRKQDSNSCVPACCKFAKQFIIICTEKKMEIDLNLQKIINVDEKKRVEKKFWGDQDMMNNVPRFAENVSWNEVRNQLADEIVPHIGECCLQNIYLVPDPKKGPALFKNMFIPIERKSK